ncbi:MAG: tricarballylate utilization 4Fe-4S protein TcuB [Gammaproteobacteria bacterium]|nr:tricarballylate utilization 4Fe-4S protein TcuB [Gammaproteobacteria bacterium]
MQPLQSAATELDRQATICNACRYCEGFCSAFGAMHRQREFSVFDLVQMANLCHNCRSCYYACQYTAPHEFNLNLPLALDTLRQHTWREYAYPSGLSEYYRRHAVAVTIVSSVVLSLLFWLMMNPPGGENFYSALSHNLLVALFTPAFVLPLFGVFAGLRRYWRDVGGQKITISQTRRALTEASQLKNLKGGHGEGCNFEDDDRYTRARLWAHHLCMYGFLLCFAATSMATVMHYMLAMPAPYPVFSPPKLAGTIGGVMLIVGCTAMLWLKYRADRALSESAVFASEVAFIASLGWVSLSGLMLYALGRSEWMRPMLALHLGAVMTFFLALPYSKMVHGFFRLAALLREAQLSEGSK